MGHRDARASSSLARLQHVRHRRASGSHPGSRAQVLLSQVHGHEREENALGTKDVPAAASERAKRTEGSASAAVEFFVGEPSTVGVSRWLRSVLTATLTAFAMCSDDFLWLMKFACDANKWKFMPVYITCMEVTAFLACLLMGFGNWLNTNTPPEVDVGTLLSGTAASCLSVYTVYLFYEWWWEIDDEDLDSEDDDDYAEGEKTYALCRQRVSFLGAGELDDGKEADDEEAELEEERKVASRRFASLPTMSYAMMQPSISTRSKTEPAFFTKTEIKSRALKKLTKFLKMSRKKDKTTVGQLITFSIFGNLDNLVLYVMLLLSSAFSPVQLLVGVLICSLVVVSICLGASMLTIVAYVFENIPVWLIMAFACTWSFVALAQGD